MAHFQAILVTVFLTLFSFAVGLPPPKSTCGYESCPKAKDGFLNIHLVPHTHDDVGWLKTYDQYYYGNRMNIQDAGVQYILDSVVQELSHDPNKRFIYVETAYFWKWWSEQSDATRHHVKKLVNRGQLEFVGGAWSMHDEATTHYQSMIDQTTWGFKRLMDTFGECGRPRVGWQIDPFGHSKENARQMAHFGFDGLFLGRIDWEDKYYRMKNKTAEMIWRTSASDSSDASKLFTGVLYNTYSSPKGFCFDVNCHDEPIVENKKSPMYNAEERASDFLNISMVYAQSYRTNNILVTMGDDFMYMDAHMNYKNMDKLIRQLNKFQKSGIKVNAFYSTPSCYLKAVNEANLHLPVKSDDFMPYSSDPFAFWTGFYTSRPTIKYFERKGNNFLQVCKQLYSIAGLGPEAKGDLIAMREAMGVMQHHDAVTGTEKQHVANDYSRILTEAFAECGEVANEAMNKLMKKGPSGDVIVESCLLRNISACSLTENNNQFVVTIYNPLSRIVDHLVKIPVKDVLDTFTVLSQEGKQLEVQVTPVSESIKSIPGRNSNANAHLFFIARSIPPLGYKSYYVNKEDRQTKSTKEITLNRQSLKVGFSEGPQIKLNKEGVMTHLIVGDKEIKVNQSFLYYEGAIGDNMVFLNRSSGAYIFRPNGTAIPVSLGSPTVKVFKGPIIYEVHQKYNDWISQVIRFAGANYVQFEWIVGPIPIKDSIGKEVITRFMTADIKNNGVFLTDSNGREYLTRVLNHRPSWNVNLSEPIPGNYYPVTTTASISDGKSRMSVVTDRAQGASSLSDGQLEFMIHRRLLHDDAFGVGEALNETAFGEGLVAVGSHYLTLDGLGQVRKLAQEKVLNAWTFISPTQGLSFDDWKNRHNMQFSALSSVLPDNVQIMTLEPWSGSSYLFRLEHIIDKNEDPQLSKPVVVNVKNLFAGWEITEIEELMLGANIKVKDSKRLVWSEEGDIDNEISQPPEQPTDPFTIMLNPMDIKTFSIQLRKL